MKKQTVVLFSLMGLFTLPFSSISSASAEPKIKVLLQCRNTSFQDLALIEVIRDQTSGRVGVVETRSNGERSAFEINLKQLTEWNIRLSDWHGYERTLRRSVYSDASIHWSIDFRDECSSGSSTAECESPRN